MSGFIIHGDFRGIHCLLRCGCDDCRHRRERAPAGACWLCEQGIPLVRYETHLEGRGRHRRRLSAPIERRPLGRGPVRLPPLFVVGFRCPDCKSRVSSKPNFRGRYECSVCGAFHDPDELEVGFPIGRE